jgi:hypothetical protein
MKGEISSSPSINCVYWLHTRRRRKMRPYPQGRLLSLLDGMKQSTAILHTVLQTSPTMKRRRRWKRRRGIALFLRRWIPLD